jgi:hypothetical protein
MAGTGGLTVYNEDGTVFVTYNISEVTIDGMTVTVAGSFDKYSKYYVMVDAGFVTDEAGNAYAGISSDTEWMFETQNFATGIIDGESISFKVYPNPFNEYIQIDNNEKLVRVVIMNIAGQKVIDLEYPENRIRTATLVSGVYLVNLFTETGLAKTERIVKR